MNEHKAVVRTPPKPVKRARTASRPKLQSIARSAKKAAGAVSRTSAKAAEPLVSSLKQEEPKTLAKMALAALAPKLLDAGLRFVIRNPLITAAGVLIVAAVVNMDDNEGDAAAAI